MDIKHKNWSEVSINLYYRILDVVEDNSRSEAEKNLALCALLCDVPEDEVYELSVDEAFSLASQIRWLNKFEFNQNFKGGKLRIDGQSYRIETNLQKMTIAQYIDFQTFYNTSHLREYYGNLLACFIIPEGKSYGEGYDIAELAASLRDSISIQLANEIVFFFLKELLTSIKAIQISSDYLMKRLIRRSKDKRKREQIQHLQNQMRRMYLALMDGSVS